MGYTPPGTRPMSPAGLVVCAFVVVAVAVSAFTVPEHTYDHQWAWSRVEGRSFLQDLGECKSQALGSGFFGPSVSASTLVTLMRARGYNQNCDICGELRWKTE